MSLAPSGKLVELQAMKTEDGQDMLGRWRFKDSLLVFERQVLVFPLLVVLLACMSFLFGGRCAAWQWWTAVAVVVGGPFLRKGGWRAALGAAILFAGLLLVLKCVLPTVLWDRTSVDMRICHFPMIQLLNEGWNPVTDPLAEGITAVLGLDLWGMAPLHVAFTQKTMAVFAAVAYKFVDDPTALTIPGLAFLWLGLALQVLREFGGVAKWVGLGSLVWVLPLVSRRAYIDESMAIASCGLLFAMANDLKNRRCSWLHLGVWTLWMVTIKPNGIAAAAVFWALHAPVSLYRMPGRRLAGLCRMTIAGMVVASVALLIAWNPYGTSWKRFGHPLYPYATVDAATHPVQNLAFDFQQVNEDFREMGRWGVWSYEYISPGMTKAFFRWKTGKMAFEPRRLWWPEGAPVFFSGCCAGKMAVWSAIAILLLLPRGRAFGAGGLLLTVLVPFGCIGYHRYLPWLSALGCLALVLAAERIEKHLSPGWRHPIGVALVACLALAGGRWLWRHARDVEFKSKECAMIRERVRCWVYLEDVDLDAIDRSTFVPAYNCLRFMENQCRLLMKELGREGRTQVLSIEGWNAEGRPNHTDWALVPLWKWDQRKWFAPEDEKTGGTITQAGPEWYERSVWDAADGVTEGEPWVMTPWDFYYVPWEGQNEHILDYWCGAEAREGEGPAARLWRRSKGMAKTWCGTMPREAWKRLKGRG